ncbi:hypothetical protein GC177_04370 [bacterium]|nr:hypothetical protein [bacterium]
MKKLISMLALSAFVAAPAFAIDATATTNTDVSTGVNTSQDSGISLSGKAKVLPHASVSTGDNTATTDVRTSVDADNSAAAARSDTTVENKSYHSMNGKGHKYGHDRRD